MPGVTLGDIGATFLGQGLACACACGSRGCACTWVSCVHALAWRVLNSRHQSMKMTSQRAAGLIVRGEIGGFSVHAVSLLGIGRGYASVSSVHALGLSVHALGSSVHALFVLSELCHGQFHKVPSFEILPGFVLAAERPKSFKTDFPSCCLVFGLLSLWASVLLSLSGGAHASIRTSPSSSALDLLGCAPSSFWWSVLSSFAAQILQNGPPPLFHSWSAWLCSLLFLVATEPPKSLKAGLPSCSFVFCAPFSVGCASVLLSLSGAPFGPLSGPNPSKRTSPAFLLPICLALLIALSGGPF